MESEHEFSHLLSSLSIEDRVIVNSLHKTACALGYVPKISPAGQKPNHWKCEYVAENIKRALCVLRITGKKFSIRTKLLYLPAYIDVVEECTERCKALLLSASKDCGHHRGSCSGPISLVVDGTSYAICSRYFTFENIRADDIEGIRKLLQQEVQYAARENRGPC